AADRVRAAARGTAAAAAAAARSAIAAAPGDVPAAGDQGRRAREARGVDRAGNDHVAHRRRHDQGEEADSTEAAVLLDGHRREGVVPGELGELTGCDDEGLRAVDRGEREDGPAGRVLDE